MEYRVEVMHADADDDGSGPWYAFSGPVQHDMEAAERELDAVRAFYDDKTKPLRIASCPKQVWTPVPTRLEQATARLQAALDAREKIGYQLDKPIIHYGQLGEATLPLRADDIRLLLDAVKGQS